MRIIARLTDGKLVIKDDVDSYIFNHDSGWFHIVKDGKGLFKPSKIVFSARIRNVKTVSLSSSDHHWRDEVWN